MKTETEAGKPRRGCEHCRINPKAIKPFMKMTRVSFGGHLRQALDETAKYRIERPECFVCGLVEDMVNGLEQAFKEK